MKTQYLTITLVADKSPDEVYNAINNVRGWWSQTLEGPSDKLNGEFIYRYKDLHYSKQKVTELVPGKKVVWLVTDSNLSFLKQDKSEWTGTKIVFDISKEWDKTKITFTHVGLTLQSECFEACYKGWNYYLQNSLPALIATGIGQPNPGELENVK